MNATRASLSRFPIALSRWPGRLLGPLFVAVVGVVLGEQYVYPNKRVLPVIIGLLIAGLAWRVGMVAGLGVLVMALPYPRGTVFGNTNLALILILLIIWLLRITQRQSPPPRRSPVDLPIAGLLIMYTVSFYNVHGSYWIVRGLQSAELFLGAVLMFYLIVNNVRRPEDLERFHQFMLISATSVFALAVYEVNHPASIFIRGWLDFSSTVGTEFNTRNVRVGSAFHDYELLSEYCAITMLLAIFMLVRARSVGRRTVYGLFLALNTFVLFTTVTRGAVMALAPGVLYLLWIVRRHIRFVPFTIVAVSLITVFVSMNFFVAHYTRSGDMIARLSETRLVGGWMPEDRAETWRNAVGRAMVHPLIGVGPTYAPLPGWPFWWPHNVYLYYANIIGFPGLMFFLWLLAKLFRITRPATDRLTHPDYAQAFLIIARTQFIVFAINEIKIDYLRNPIYMFPVWVLFAMWTATSMVARTQAAPAAAPALSAPATAPLPAAAR